MQLRKAYHLSLGLFRRTYTGKFFFNLIISTVFSWLEIWKVFEATFVSQPSAKF